MDQIRHKKKKQAKRKLSEEIEAVINAPKKRASSKFRDSDDSASSLSESDEDAQKADVRKERKKIDSIIAKLDSNVSYKFKLLEIIEYFCCIQVYRVYKSILVNAILIHCYCLY